MHRRAKSLARSEQGSHEDPRLRARRIDSATNDRGRDRSLEEIRQEKEVEQDSPHCYPKD